MQPKTIKILYWTLTIILCLMLVFDAIGGLTMVPEGQVALQHLGIPIYLMPFFGVVKLLAVIALLQTKYRRIKEWAFAGLVFNLAGAAWANGTVDGSKGFVWLPLILLVIVFLIHSLWHQYDRITQPQTKSI